MCFKQSPTHQVHYFVATGGTGKKMYGTCLTLWEPYTIPGRKKKPESGEDGNSTDHDVFLPKCVVLLSTYPYLMAFREYLTQLNRLSKMGEMTLPIERYITNICLEVPAPPPGSFEVQTTILDSIIKIWSPPHNQPIAWVSLPFSHLFECLDVDNIILVWHCLVLERQVLLTSTQLSILTTCSEILLSMLFPMRWSHAYIPVLPSFLIPILSAPMPFFCGINKASLADALYDLSRECVVVDLDKNLVTMGPDTEPLPPLPPQQAASLRTQLQENAGMVFREARSLTKNDDYSDSGSRLPTHIKQMAEAMWEGKLSLFDEAFHLMFTPEEARKNLLNGNDASGMDWGDRDAHDQARIMASGGDKASLRKQSEWDAVQEAFLDTFVYLLRNYRKYLVFPSKHNEGSYGGAGFRSKEFIESQRLDMREFLEQFIGTQMFDNFITKRLYGSGESDVAFFDLAVDRFLKSAGLLSNVDVGGRLLQAAGYQKGSGSSGGMRSSMFSYQKNTEPLLQSARVHRKLKTIVPPEPCQEDLPPIDQVEGIASVSAETSNVSDDMSVGSASTSSRASASASRNSDVFKSVQDKAAEILGKNKLRYTYETFPSEFREGFFSTPRPLPAAVIAEFDRQKKDAAQFRRKKPVLQAKDKRKHIQRAHSTMDPETPPSPEVATFTVFFMAFTAMVGKELMEIDYAADQEGKLILSTYVPTTKCDDTESETATADSTGEESEISEEEKEGVAEMKTSRPSLGDMFRGDSDGDLPTVETKNDTDNSKADKATKKENKAYETKNDDIPTFATTEYKTPEKPKANNGQPRQRFRDSLNALQIEEAKATGRAQLGLAFEMLTMMKKRALKADPEAYQSLIDACGRVGDTKRATDLLAKMHEDGIVADGTVYACLVSAFSADSAWRNGTKEEDLPEWANSTAVEMDWNKLQKRTFLDRLRGRGDDDSEDEVNEHDAVGASMHRFRKFIAQRQGKKRLTPKLEESRVEFYVTEAVERQIELGENLLEIVFPDISVDTDNETCPRCNFLLSDDDVVAGWTPGDSNDYTTSCPNCTQRFVPHFCVQSSSPSFVGSRGPSSPLMCERLSPWVLQKEIRSVMSDREGIENLLDPAWRQEEYKNAVLWWNLVLSCMRYRFPFSFLLQGNFEQNLIAPMPEDDDH
jgi:pentatricopeptide repeat protein